MHSGSGRRLGGSSSQSSRTGSGRRLGESSSQSSHSGSGRRLGGSSSQNIPLGPNNPFYPSYLQNSSPRTYFPSRQPPASLEEDTILEINPDLLDWQEWEEPVQFISRRRKPKPEPVFLSCLRDGQLLIDETVDKYLKQVCRNVNQWKDPKELCVIMPTLFFWHLEHLPDEIWEPPPDLLQARFVVVPIAKHTHWHVFIFDLETHRIQLFDSNFKKVKIGQYEEQTNLIVQWLDHFFRPIDWNLYLNEKINLQRNAIDCGVFLLANVERFLLSPDQQIDYITQQEIPAYRKMLRSVLEEEEG